MQHYYANFLTGNYSNAEISEGVTIATEAIDIYDNNEDENILDQADVVPCEHAEPYELALRKRGWTTVADHGDGLLVRKIQPGENLPEVEPVYFGRVINDGESGERSIYVAPFHDPSRRADTVEVGRSTDVGHWVKALGKNGWLAHIVDTDADEPFFTLFKES